RRVDGRLRRTRLRAAAPAPLLRGRRPFGGALALGRRDRRGRVRRRGRLRTPRRRQLAVPVPGAGLARRGHGGSVPRCRHRLRPRAPAPPARLARWPRRRLLGEPPGRLPPLLRPGATLVPPMSAAPPVELHVISDSTGETAARLVSALEAQFPDLEFEEVRHPRVETVDDLRLAVARMRGRRAVAVYTLVQ